MPITYQEPPAETLETLRDSVESMPRSFEGHAQIIRDVLAHPDQHWPHPVYIAGLRDMASKDGLAQAEKIAWRYLAHTSGNRNYAIEVQDDADWDGQQLTEIDKGPFIDAMYQVLEDANLARRAGDAEMKLSVLRINAMGIFAVWLRADNAANDLIIPLQPAPEFLTPGQPYSVAEFQETLQPRAKSRLKSSRTSDA
ncbi:MAG: hypothetical protein SF339_11895 [Blastocatellia bacterium]|nr:hypothetical protein [Blastocatellia bacterium]